MPSLHAFVLTLLQTLVTALIVAIIGRSILSFVVRDWRNPLLRFLYDITEPVLAPVRRVLPVAMGGLDFSPFLVIMGLWLLLDVVQRLNP
jgi:YggT family protein